MNRRRGLLATLGWAAASGSPLALAQSPAPLVGELKSLGRDRYQIGAIVVDKRARNFTVPGRVHLLGKPLEYLATAPGGMKAYETLLELDAVGSEFNLACILIGLEAGPRQEPGSRVVKGPRVAISVSWVEGGKRRQVSAAEAILNPEAGVKPESVEWVYTGSFVSGPNSDFAADASGTLIGFIHDSNCIIDSAVAVGIGAYGSVRGSALVPPVGSPIQLIVDAASFAK
jgi:hypothetical protein